MRAADRHGGGSRFGTSGKRMKKKKKKKKLSSAQFNLDVERRKEEKSFFGPFTSQL